jgi:hypothetical protein
MKVARRSGFGVAVWSGVLVLAALPFCACGSSNGDGAPDATAAGVDATTTSEGHKADAGKTGSPADGRAAVGDGRVADTGTGEGDGGAKDGAMDVDEATDGDAGTEGDALEADTGASPTESGAGGGDGARDIGDARGSGEDASDGGHGPGLEGGDAHADDAGDGPAEAGSTDAKKNDDATPDAAPDATSDAASDAQCTAVASFTFVCPSACNGATNYCLGGGVPNTCEPIPAACQCAQTHTCDCLLANVTSPCTGGILTCTSTGTDGELNVLVHDCQ